MTKLPQEKKYQLSDFEINKFVSKAIKDAPFLTADDEWKLLASAQSGDIAARNYLVQSNLPFVVSIAKKYCNRGVDMPDLVSYGTFGLFDAIEKYSFDIITKAGKNIRLKTFASWHIRKRILLSIHAAPQIRIPIAKRYLVIRYMEHINDSIGQQTDEDVAKCLKWSVAKVRDIRQTYRLHDLMAATIGAANIACDNAYDTSGKLILDALDNMHDPYKTILCMRYGIGCDIALLKDIGRRFNRTTEWARQTERHAMKILRNIFEYYENAI